MVVNFLLLMVVYMLSRWVFFYMNKSSFPDVTFEDMMTICLGGLRFDISALCYLNMLCITLQFLPIKVRDTVWYQRIVKTLFIVINALGIAVNAADIVYFEFGGRRTTFTIFSEFGGESNLGTIFLNSITNYWEVWLFGIAMIAIIAFLYYNPIKQDRPASSYPANKIYYSLHTVIFIIAGILVAGGARGGLKLKMHPLRQDSAELYCKKPLEAAIVLNTPFTLVTTAHKTGYKDPGFFAKENDSIMAKLLPSVLRFAHKRENLLVIFQNKEDKELYIKNGFINEKQARFIKGSGIDLNEFCYTSEPSEGKIIVLMTCRIIREKGVFELAKAAEILRSECESKAEFWIVGGLDDHPDAITKEEMDAVCDGRYIKWLGRRENVKETLRQCHIFAFPSYYMEGLPKSLIEACAIGRPIVTTDNIGCRDVVTDGENGFLVPVKDATALAHKIKVLMDNPELRLKMGLAAREKAEKEFSVDDVIKKHLEIYQELVS